MKEATKGTKLLPRNFKMEEFMRTRYLAYAAAGTTKEDILRPDYWAHVSGQLRPMSRVEVIIEDCSALYEVIVIKSSRTEAVVKLINEVKLDLSNNDEEHESEASSDYMIKWFGQVDKWGAVRKSDKRKMCSGMSTRGEAEAHMKDYVKALAA